MKKTVLFLIILLFLSSTVISAQNSVQNKRRDCSFVGRPIIDIGGGVVNGIAVKIIRPRLNNTAKRFAQNAVVSVKIEISEKGEVVYAKATGAIPILFNPSEEAARRTKFSPTIVDGRSVKISGQITYKFYQGKAGVSYKLESVEHKSAPIDYEWLELRRIFDRNIVSAIEDSKEGKTLDSYEFIENKQARIQICLQTKTPDIVEKIKQTGFEILEETQGNGLAGKIAVENLIKLAGIDEIRFIVPEPKSSVAPLSQIFYHKSLCSNAICTAGNANTRCATTTASCANSAGASNS